MLAIIVAPGRLSVAPAPIGRGALFGIDLLGEIHRALHVGEEEVTCFRSPSSALRDVRTFSARCFGV
jgi:hypothetical protein